MVILGYNIAQENLGYVMYTIVSLSTIIINWVPDTYLKTPFDVRTAVHMIWPYHMSCRVVTSTPRLDKILGTYGNTKVQTLTVVAGQQQDGLGLNSSLVIWWTQVQLQCSNSDWQVAVSNIHLIYHAVGATMGITPYYTQESVEEKITFIFILYY